MARRKQLTETLKGQITNEEREERLKQEEKLKDFSPLQEKPPYWLSKMAKNEWRRIYPHIIKMPISELDSTLLAIYCNSYAQYRQATADILKNGQVMYEVNSRGEKVKKKNPSVDIMNSMSKEIRGIAGQLGLSLDSRLRIVGLDNEDDDVDPFAALMNDDD
ncbi:phage terminase small subunit P27 family [Bacillus haynesii]|nr:phage terminase small subunit P27 family [Bacillus haynesii]